MWILVYLYSLLALIGKIAEIVGPLLTYFQLMQTFSSTEAQCLRCCQMLTCVLVQWRAPSYHRAIATWMYPAPEDLRLPLGWRCPDAGECDYRGTELLYTRAGNSVIYWSCLRNVAVKASSSDTVKTNSVLGKHGTPFGTAHTTAAFLLISLIVVLPNHKQSDAHIVVACNCSRYGSSAVRTVVPKDCSVSHVSWCQLPANIRMTFCSLAPVKKQKVLYEQSVYCTPSQRDIGPFQHHSLNTINLNN